MIVAAAPAASRSAARFATSRSAPKPTFSLNARYPAATFASAVAATSSGPRPLA
jgi:hypothetical protein